MKNEMRNAQWNMKGTHPQPLPVNLIFNEKYHQSEGLFILSPPVLAINIPLLQSGFA